MPRSSASWIVAIPSASLVGPYMPDMAMQPRASSRVVMGGTICEKRSGWRSTNDRAILSLARRCFMPEAAPEIGLTVMRGALRVLSRTAPRVATRIAADLFMKPRRFRTPPREQALLHGAEPFEIRAGQATTIRAWRWGSGPVAILVHGWEGRGSQMASFVEPLVASGRTVIAFDAPGHGTSGGNRSSLPHFAWALRSVAAAVSDNAPDSIVAHSLGCAATTLALREGLAARRAVFISPP